MTSFGSGEKSVIYRLDIIFSITHVSKDQLVLAEIFVDIRRGILEERCQTSYHVRKLKNGNGLLFLCDT